MTYFSAPGIISEREPYRAVYNLLKVTKKQLISNSRKREIVTGRYLIMNMLKQTTNRSLDSIGAEFKKDHSSVIHGIKQYNNLYDTDKEFRRLADEFNGMVGITLMWYEPVFIYGQNEINLWIKHE